MEDTTVATQAEPGTQAGSRQAMRWLLLTHHLPPEPAYFRVKVRRRLDRIGAVPLKNSVYVLPYSDDAFEDLQWIFLEIEREGGEASVSEAAFLDGVTDGRIVEAFRHARETAYDEVAQSARALMAELGSVDGPGALTGAKVQRLTRRLEEVVVVDYFGASGREAAEQAVAAVRAASTGARGSGESASKERAATGPTADVGRGRTWVTRAGAKVDRIASAWLIRRFIDPDARFRFVAAQEHEPAEGEIRFDMFAGEFTHVGDACTFETLVASFALSGAGLGAIAEIVHDLDCKDEKFGRPEAPGVASMIDGIVRRHADDEARLERGGELLDELYEHFAASDE